LNELDQIWREIKRGNEKAFYMLYTLLFSNLVRYIQQIVKDIFLAEDIVQEVFIKLWDERNKIHIVGSLQSYLYKMSHNLSINKLQHFATAKNKVNRTISEEEWQFIKDTYQIDSYVIENIEKEDTDVIIRQVIASLPEKCREVFILSRYENLDNNEIAQRLNISVNTVRSHIYQALEIIRQKVMK
jgi:RNA polymerase sigma-70 factor (ECF subfamily)